MKRILFALDHINVGGVEKAFLGMIDALPRDKYEVHAAFEVPEGGFLPYIPDWVNVHPIAPFYDNIYFIKHPMKATLRDLLRGRRDALPRAFAFLKSKIDHTKDAISAYLLRNDDAFSIEFDLAVSYAAPHEYLDYYIARHVKARRRAAWIHFDVSRCYTSPRSIRRNMSLDDKIFVVSERGREIFNRLYPELADKTEVFRNIISPDIIRRDAARPSAYRAVPGAINIVTVGRLNPEKGQRLAIAALALFRSRGHEAVLHLVGSGTDEDYCRQLAVDAGIDEYVRFYGAQANPYPYMAAADIYLQPSLHEGYCITLAEAKLFEAPIVATDFTGAREQLSQRPGAVIAADFTPEAIADALAEALTKPRSVSPDAPVNDMDKFLRLLED